MVSTLFTSLAIAACAALPSSDENLQRTVQAASGTCAIPPIIDQSLLVTDATALANFSLETVMNKIVSTGSSNTGQTATSLYQQMMDTLNDEAHAQTKGPHCTATLNGFPNECPRQEGILASTAHNPFTGGTNPDAYKPLALVNRFDLAPKSGANCGEYRIVYGKESGQPGGTNRMLLIFEATLPNPDPNPTNLDGCLPVAQFWDNLSASTTTVASRAAALQNFYFKGLTGFAPVIQASNYGFGNTTNTGQIRANMFMFQFETQGWQLREFRLSQSCVGTACTLTANNTLVQNNPDMSLFGGSGNAFQTVFLTQIKALSAKTITGITMTTPRADCAAASTSLDEPGNPGNGFPADPPITNYPAVVSSAFLTAIQNAIPDGGTLTAANIVARAETQSCAGCHEVSQNAGPDLGGGLPAWPPSNGFTQIDENQLLSKALTDFFLPHRSKVLEDFINNHCGDGGTADVDDGLTIGGSAPGSAN